MEVRGVHYGLSLLYSYLLPLFRVEEVHDGFLFEKAHGAGKGLVCRFRVSELVAECKTPSSVSADVIKKLLGLEKRWVFLELCSRLGFKPGECPITLLYEPLDARYVFYAVFLSRNTDYFVNTVAWTVQAVEKGLIESNSYIPREFNRLRSVIDGVFNEGLTSEEIALRLLSIPGVGVKSVTALLLHGYGNTVYAPVDRHYASYLGLAVSQPPKSYCAAQKLNCRVCPRTCPYGFASRKYGVFNGVVQSLVYVRSKLAAKRTGSFWSILVRDSGYWFDRLDSILERAREFLI